MTQKDDGGPAFPLKDALVSEDFNPKALDSHGMSLRDWFAGQFLAAALVNAEGLTNESIDELIPVAAASCYRIADIMIKERGK